MRHQNEHHSDPIEVPKIGKGDLVLVKDDELKRSLWDLALVQEILPSNDGKTRAVKIKTKNGEITRPIIKLYPILTAEQLNPTNQGQNQDEGQVEGQNESPIEDLPGLPAAAADDGAMPPAPPPQPAQLAPPPSTSRPQRAAKAAARTWLQGVTRDLLDD